MVAIKTANKHMRYIVFAMLSLPYLLFLVMYFVLFYKIYTKKRIHEQPPYKIQNAACQLTYGVFIVLLHILLMIPS